MLQKCALKEYPEPLAVVNHNIVAIYKKTKVPKAGPNIMYERSYKKFCSDFNVVVNNICWSIVGNEEQTDAALDTFMK